MPETWLQLLREPVAREAVIDAITALFKRWHLHPVNQAELLGLPDMTDLAQYKSAGRDPGVFERIGQLLAIDRALLKRYPYQARKRDRWVWQTTARLHNQTPIAYMLARGLDGIKQVRQLLESS